MRVLRQVRYRETIQHTLPTFAELSREGHPDDDPQHIGGSARINTHTSKALKHWIKVHNDLPRSANQYSPNAIMDNDHQVDAKYQY